MTRIEKRKGQYVKSDDVSKGAEIMFLKNGVKEYAMNDVVQLPE